VLFLTPGTYPLPLGGFHVPGKKPANDREESGRDSAEPEAFPSGFREARRATNLLLKLKRFESKMANFRADYGENNAEEDRE